MNFLKTKPIDSKIFTILLILMLSLSSALLLLPAANAHVPSWSIPTTAFINVAPNPIGVGQTATVVIWIDKNPPTATLTGGDRWQNMKVTMTMPNGTTVDYPPMTSDPTGGTYLQFTPDVIGNFSFVFTWPGQKLSLVNPLSGEAGSSSVYVNDTYVASTSKTFVLTVQNEAIASIPQYPLPTEYWTRPIEGQNDQWYRVASNWLSGSKNPKYVQPDGIAPNAPHIMWTKPVNDGGVVGGSTVGTPGMAFYSGMSYNARFANSIIMDGRLYYELPLQNSPNGGGYISVDLRTGQQIWYQTAAQIGTVPSFGQYYDFESPNQHGVIPNGLLWTTNFAKAIDPLTGVNVYNLTNVPSGFDATGPQGEILRYQLNIAAHWIAQWNSSRVTTAPTTGTIGTGTISANTSSCYDWNVTLPSAIPTGTSIVGAIVNDMLLGSSSLTSFSGWGTPDPYTFWAISIKPGPTRGTLLWIQNYTAPPNNATRNLQAIDPVNRVFITLDKESFLFTGFSLDTGQQLWQTIKYPSMSDYEFFEQVFTKTSITTAYGRLYASAWSGILYCWDTKTGNLLFTYGNGGAGNSTNSGLETVYGNYPTFLMAIADGKVYLGPGEHSPNSPLWKGGLIRAVDAYTGKEVWTLPGWFGYTGRAAAVETDGYFAYINLYDNQIYAIGKGPSATTVDAPQLAVTAGDSVVIRGTVTDISAGTKQAAQAANFPNGVPAVSDASMSDWMTYVYMQKPMPTNTVGVQVSLDALDPNGNFIHLGNATSDTTGLYSYMWTTPNVPGKYTIVATFSGTESYWGSYTETSMGVTEAATTPVPTNAQLSFDSVTQSVQTTVILVGIAIIIAVAIATVLLLRKKP